jgi:hypothetical protein
MHEAQHLVDGRFTGSATKPVRTVDESVVGLVCADDGPS